MADFRERIEDTIDDFLDSVSTIWEAHRHPIERFRTGEPHLTRRQSFVELGLIALETAAALAAANKLIIPGARRAQEYVSLESITFQDLLHDPQSYVNKSIRGCIIKDAVGQYLGTMPVGDDVWDTFLFYSRDSLTQLPSGSIPTVMGIMKKVDHEKYPPRLVGATGIAANPFAQLDPNFPHPTVNPQLEGAVFDFSAHTIHIGNINPPLQGLAIDPKTDSQIGREDQGVLDVVEHVYLMQPLTSICFNVDAES